MMCTSICDKPCSPQCGAYTPTTEEVRARYNADEFGYSAGLNDPCPEFDRWLAEVKAERDKHIISLIKKDCEHAKFGDYCIHDHLIGEIEAQLNREGEK